MLRNTLLLSLAVIALQGCSGSHVSEGILSGDATWAHEHLVAGDVTITDGTLSVEPCTTVKVASGATITVSFGGALRAVGDADCPITFTAEDGPWGGIVFNGSSNGDDNALVSTVVEDAGTGDADSHTQNQGGLADLPWAATIWVDQGASVTITDSTIRDGLGAGIASFNHIVSDPRGIELRDFTGNTVTGNAGAPIRLDANFIDQVGAGTYSPNAVEGIAVEYGFVDHDTTWRELGVPYVSEHGFVIGSPNEGAGSATLTLDAGVTLEFGTEGATFALDGGHLALAGTPDQRVRITSSSSTPAAGDWGYISLDTSGNSFAHADIEYGGMVDHSPDLTYPQVILGGGLDLDDVAFAHSAMCDILVNGGTLTATDSTYVPCE